MQALLRLPSLVYILQSPANTNCGQSVFTSRPLTEGCIALCSVWTCINSMSITNIWSSEANISVQKRYQGAEYQAASRGLVSARNRKLDTTRQAQMIRLTGYTCVTCKLQLASDQAKKHEMQLLDRDMRTVLHDADSLCSWWASQRFS